MGNISGVLALFSVLVRPSLVVPHVQVTDISSLDWGSLHASGIRALLFDKDNCLTKPHSDVLEASLASSWAEAIRTFGRENILIVSNSAGSSDDPSGLGAESLSRSLGVPVLSHRHKKPAASCAREALAYLSGSEGGKILVVGDRTMTDVVLAHRMNDMRPASTVSVLTSGIWQNEGWANTLMRRMERRLTSALVQRGVRPAQRGGIWFPRPPSQDTGVDWQKVATVSAAAPTPALALGSARRGMSLSRAWSTVIQGIQEGVRPPNPFETRAGPRRHYSPPPTRARGPGRQQWAAALAALVLLPAGYYAGLYLHELRDAPAAPPPPTTPESIAKAHAAARYERRRAAELDLVHLRRERDDIHAKLTRLQSRMRAE